MSYSFNCYTLPDHMKAAIDHYVTTGEMPGGHFLMAVLLNNLSDAVGSADGTSMANLPAFVGYLYNECPALCWGTLERVTAWSGKFKKPNPRTEGPATADQLAALPRVVRDDAKAPL
jgi:hypothetical protein